jgi:23S rRNA pseudouridine2605 synthase
MPPKPRHRHFDPGAPVRLQVFLARSGVASRRACEELIAQGRVSVNGEVVTTPGTRITPGTDVVAMDGEAVEAPPVTWIALHKPSGYVTSRQDAFHRATVYDLLPERFHSLFHVGRLDRDSEGLLLLTNDGEAANRFLHPSFGVTKEYEVDVDGKPSNDAMRQLTSGVELDDGIAQAESVRRLGEVAQNVFRLRVVLREGKKREVRRMMEALGHPVRRLLRTRFGPIELGELGSGKWRFVGKTEVASRGPDAPPPRRSRPRADDEAEERATRSGRSRKAERGAVDGAPPLGKPGARKPGAGVDRPRSRPSRAGADDAPGRRSEGAPPRGKPGARKPGAGVDRPRSRPSREGADEAPARRTEGAPPRGKPGVRKPGAGVDRPRGRPSRAGADDAKPARRSEGAPPRGKPGARKPTAATDRPRGRPSREGADEAPARRTEAGSTRGKPGARKPATGPTRSRPVRDRSDDSAGKRPGSRDERPGRPERKPGPGTGARRGPGSRAETEEPRKSGGRPGGSAARPHRPRSSDDGGDAPMGGDRPPRRSGGRPDSRTETGRPLRSSGPSRGGRDDGPPRGGRPGGKGGAPGKGRPGGGRPGPGKGPGPRSGGGRGGGGKGGGRPRGG